MKSKIILIGGGAGLGALMLISSLQSCKVVQPLKSYSKIDTTTIKETPVDLLVKGGKVETSLNMELMMARYQKKREQYLVDSTNAANQGKPLPEPPETEKQSFTDADTRAVLTYWIDKAGKLQLGCESKDQTITFLQKEITRLTKEVNTQKELIKEIPPWAVMLFGALGTLLVISLLLNFILFKTKK